MPEIKMIDVSVHQGFIDWPKVAASGIKNAFIRVGYCNYDGPITEGLDKLFHENMKNAIAAGVNVGVYVYSYAKTPAAAVIAARDVLRLIKPYRVTIPVAFDIEEKQYRANSKAYNSSIATAFLKEIQAAGYYSMLYANKDFAVNVLDMTALSDFDFWLAEYNPKPSYKGNFGIWQYSETGRVFGINGNVDQNIAYMDYAKIITEKGLNNLSAPPLVDSDLVAAMEEVKAKAKELQQLAQEAIDKANNPSGK